MAGQTMDVVLDNGEIDGCTAIRPTARVTAGDPAMIDRWGGTSIDDNPRIRPLLPAGSKEVAYERVRTQLSTSLRNGWHRPDMGSLRLEVSRARHALL